MTDSDKLLRAMDAAYRDLKAREPEVGDEERVRVMDWATEGPYALYEVHVVVSRKE